MVMNTRESDNDGGDTVGLHVRLEQSVESTQALRHINAQVCL